MMGQANYKTIATVVVATEPQKSVPKQCDNCNRAILKVAASSYSIYMKNHKASADKTKQPPNGAAEESKSGSANV